MTDNNRPPKRPGAPPHAPAERRRPAPAPQAEARDDARIAKIIARAGVCSRRDAESWIAAGRVAVNGTVIESPALNVGDGDRITIDGTPLPERERTRLYLFHKPRGVVTTARDPEGRQTIFDVLPPELPRVVTIGRLDINTEGLLLLTNDGGLARQLELPATGWLRRYRVRANGNVIQPQLDDLAKGITVEGVDYAGIEARLDRIQGANLWLTMGLREGKNREIKRILEHLGLAVTRLIRLSFGPFQLGDLAEGAVEEVPLRILRDQLGETLARNAGVDLEDRPEPRAPRGRALPVPKPVAPAITSRPAAGPRAHVSALRSARDDAAPEERRRTERGATADRRGRSVAVERVSSTMARDDGSDSRNSRRFARDKAAPDGRDGAAPRRSGGERPAGGRAPPRRFDGERPGRDRPERKSFDAPRPARATGRGPAASDRRPSDRPWSDERPRPEGRARPETRTRPEARARPEARPAAPRRPSEASRPDRAERPEGRGTVRPARARDDRPARTRDERPARSREARPEREERPGRDARAARPGGANGARDRSGPPRGERRSEGAASGRPPRSGAPGKPRSAGGKFGGERPRSAKPGGFKPRTGKPDGSGPRPRPSGGGRPRA